MVGLFRDFFIWFCGLFFFIFVFNLIFCLFLGVSGFFFRVCIGLLVRLKCLIIFCFVCFNGSNGRNIVLES